MSIGTILLRLFRNWVWLTLYVMASWLKIYHVIALEFMMYLFSLIHMSYLIQKQKVIPIVAESTKWEFIDSMKDEKTQNVDEC